MVTPKKSTPGGSKPGKGSRTTSKAPPESRTAAKASTAPGAGTAARASSASSKSATQGSGGKRAARPAGSKPRGAAPDRAGKSAREAAPPAGRARVEHKGADPHERLQLLQQEKAELQEIMRTLKAERDSALAENTRLDERVRGLEAEASRRSVREPQQAGPGAFDPSVDLDEEGAVEPDEEDFEGAASFFDRMEELRARRIELDRERSDRELEQSEQSFWLICPKCGDLMEEQESENVKLERCDNCGGLYLDRGEVDLLLTIAIQRDGLRRLHNVLKF